MKLLLTLFIILVICKVSFSQSPLELDKSENIAVDTFFNDFIIEDKYRWLESTDSEKVKKWIEEQNKNSKHFLSKATTKTHAFSSIDRYAYTQYENPVKQGDYYFTYAYYNNLGVPALFYRTSLKFNPELIVDPNYISKKDKIRLRGFKVSKDSKLLAYQFSRNGSDWCELKVVSLKTALHKDDHLQNLKFSNIAWKDDGFFYSTYNRTDKFGKTLGQQIYYHKIGTPQSEDKLIFKRNNPSTHFSFKTTSNERFFIIKEFNEDRGVRNFFYIDYQSDNPTLKPLLTNVKYALSILDSREGKFIAETTHNAKNGSVVEIDPQKPFNWRVIAPAFSKALLLESTPLNDKIINVYQSNQHPILSVIDYNGEVLYNLEFPGATSVRGFSGKPDDEELLFNYSSYTIPPIVYKFNTKTFERKLVQQTKVNFDFNQIKYTETEYLARDSTKVPIILVHRKDLELDGENPTILKAYGGFGAISLPSFDPGIVYFVLNNGVFAFANIRGGGDFGASWAKQGRGLNKQTSINDFIDAAQFLINSAYTSPSKLGATGGSNGGLVVAAAGIQRPDLFKAVVPVVAPTDMIRFEKFTVGHLHVDEYGSIQDSLGFRSLLAYSPLHNIKREINYPSMLIMTSDNDDRVPPFHSYKFAASLQERTAQKNPIILRVEKNSGHYGASTFLTTIREKAHLYGFIMNAIKNE